MHLINIDQININIMSTKALHNNSTLVGKQPMPIVVGGGARKLLESYLNDVLQTPHTKNAIAKRSRKIESTGLTKGSLLFITIYSFSMASCRNSVLDDGNYCRSLCIDTF